MCDFDSTNRNSVIICGLRYGDALDQDERSNVRELNDLESASADDDRAVMAVKM